MKYYSSPRWSGEILDCSMPMTFDTYNKCSYNCLYCFAFFQKSHTVGAGGAVIGKHEYQGSSPLQFVNPSAVKKVFTDLENKNNQFAEYVRQRKAMQWGGMADQFDEYERKHGVTLELLEFFSELRYPLSFSTKAVWWLQDDRYRAYFQDKTMWSCKFSIINLDTEKAKKMEAGVASPTDRLAAIKQYCELGAGDAVLRLRPFIIGYSDRNDEYLELIRLAAAAGAKAVSTEFFCLETRADERLHSRYNKMSEIIGFDIFDFYKKNSHGSGYRRLNYGIKAPYIEKMEALCKKLGLRFYVSDAHHKEKCANGSCCGLPESFNYSRGQFTEALLLAKKNGKVHFSDISKEINALYSNFLWRRASGLNTTGCATRSSRLEMTMADYMRMVWNTPNMKNSPYKYFGGILFPTGLDKNNDVIYEYRGGKK